MRELLGAVYLLAPLLGGALFHGLCVRYNWLSFLARPIDRGRKLRGRPLFGRNKTYRGPVALGLGTALVAGLQADVLHYLPGVEQMELFDYGCINGWFFGATMGTASMLSELPNSLLKRQLGVAPGQTAEGVLAGVLYFLDQVDLLAGVWLVIAVIVPSVVTLERVLLSVGIVFFVHQLTTVIGYVLGMRETPR